MPPSVSVPNAPVRTLLLVNLGTPEAPTAPAVRAYLAEFLADRRVVAIPPLLWQPLLRGLILPLRGPRSAAKYASVWLPEGSPLAVYTRRLAAAVQARLPDWRVDWAMRYGRPALAELLARAQGEVVVLPLYPQYSTTTTASVRDVVDTAGVPVRFVDHYFDEPAWVAAVAASIARWRGQHGAGDHLLFSFHGLPQRVADAGDPYPRQCERSAALIAATLGLGKGEWSLSYQSRFGRERWLQPATDAHLRALHAGGAARVDVACPGFAADCLETLEEIAMFNAHLLEAQGGQLRYIPCLNDDAAHADALAGLARRQLEHAA